MSAGDRRARLASARLYFVCSSQPGGRPLRDVLEPALEGGVDVFQLRDKDGADAAILEAAAAAGELCRAAGALFFVNDRPDLAIEADADGVHVGQDDAPPALARRILGPDAIVGLSTHAPVELEAAADEPVDYVSAGPVVPTPTKPGRAGTGIEYVRYAAGRSVRPFFVTGGATPATVGDIVRAGGTRVVVVRWLTEAADPESAARALRQALDAALATT